MTTYPLSEPATIYAAEGAEEESVSGQGSLGDCAELLAGFSPEKRASARIEMDAMDLKFGSREIDELLRFLRDEDEGLSNHEIEAIPDPDS